MNYLIAYAKLSIDKEEGIELLGVYFGGIATTESEADEIATECVNQVKGSTVIPAIMQIKHSHDLLDTLDEAHDRFEAKTEQMREADAIMSRSSRLGKKSRKTIKRLLDPPESDQA